jgi:predicted Zn-dependent protease
MGQSGLLTMLTFNRAQEEEADATALAALVKVYGHAGGSTDLFDVLRKAAQQPEPPKFLSTHPLSGDRTQRLVALARAKGWPLDGVRTPLPKEIQTLIAGAPTEEKAD